MHKTEIRERLLEQADRDRLQKLARKLARKFAEVEIDEEIRKETPVKPEDILKIWNDFAAREKDPDLYKFIANLYAATKKSIVIEAMKGKVSDLITFKRLVTVDTRKVKKTVEIKGAEWEEAVRNKYFELIKDEVRKRQLFERDVIMQELKDLTHIWKPFDPQENPAFTKYRYSSPELYADAFSVLINDPVQLEKTASQFNRAFFNYMGNEPEMARVYAELQRQTGMSEAELYKLRHGNIQQMFKRSAEKRLAMEKREEPGILHDILVKFADENYPLIEKVAKVQKKEGVRPEDNPQYWKEEMPYVQSAAFQYMRDIDNYVLKPLKESKITEGDLGEFLLLRRSATERKYLANPMGYNVLESKRQAKQMLLDLGSQRAKALLQAVHYYDRIRKHHITSFLKKSRMLSDELMGYIENNENYATFNVSKYMEEKYGDNALTASIKRQLGTLSEIENPLYATVAKDAVMVRAASRKLVAEKFVEFMKDHYPGEIKESRKVYDANLGGMKVRESAERGKKTVLLMDKGEWSGTTWTRNWPNCSNGIRDSSAGA